MSETFVDQPTQVMPAPDTWGDLTLNQLLDTKNQLLDKLYLARKKPQYLPALTAAMIKLDAFIEIKLADPRGGS